jgi:predicted nucleic acid-binding protein
VLTLVDTNVLVYRFDGRFPEKQATADRLLRDGLEDDSLRVAHQAIVEFVAAVTRPAPDGASILPRRAALVEAEDLLRQFPVIYPDEQVVRAALLGMATYEFSWFDAHMWAYAEVNGLGILWSQDFQHERYYGRVQVLNPFADVGGGESGGG